jgi:hypothetical protein
MLARVVSKGAVRARTGAANGVNSFMACEIAMVRAGHNACRTQRMAASDTL